MAKLEAIQEKIKKLQAQADALIAKKAQVAVNHIRKIMIEHGLTTEAIEAAAKSKRDAQLRKLSVSTVKAARKPKANAIDIPASAEKGRPKYQDLKTGATWSGFGRAPAWIVGAKDRTKFLVTTETTSLAPLKAATGVTPRRKASKNVVVANEPVVKNARAKKVAAKKSAVTNAPSRKLAAKNGAAKKLVVKKVAAKKVSLRSVAAKKASARKGPAKKALATAAGATTK